MLADAGELKTDCRASVRGGGDGEFAVFREEAGFTDAFVFSNATVDLE